MQERAVFLPREEKQPCDRARKKGLCGTLLIYGAQASLDGEEMQEGLIQGDRQADGVPAPLIALSKKGLG